MIPVSCTTLNLNRSTIAVLMIVMSNVHSHDDRKGGGGERKKE